MKRLLPLILLLSCGPTPHPQPLPAPFDTAAHTAMCDRIWRVELERPIDASGLAGCLSEFRSGASEAQVTANVRASEEYAKLHAPPPAVPPAPVLHADGHIFRSADHKPWRYKGVSAFQLLDRFVKGENIDPFLNAYKGFNTLRVWPYVPKADWGSSAWDVPSVEDTKRFLEYVKVRGWTVELTLLTDDSPARLAWAKLYLTELAKAPKPTNLLVELGNEPRTHKHINVDALRTAAEASGFTYTSGGYESADVVFGDYLTHHSRRDSEWPRRSHDCHDWWDSSPDFAAPPHHVPCVLDEPPKMQDVHPATEDDWRAYFGGASLMGAGATFHSETGKFAKVPTAQEKVLIAAALEGLNAFPETASLLAYGRPVESSLRTYTAGGKYMVRVRPTTDTPGSGWQRIGSSRILWRKP